MDFWEHWLQLEFQGQLSWRQNFLVRDCKFPKKLEWGFKFLEHHINICSHRPLFWGHGNSKAEEEKKSEKKGASVGSKKSLQQHSTAGGNPLKPPFKDAPLSNFDLLDWVKFLKIKNFKGIFSRDSKDHLHHTGCCIINLDDSVGNGTYWVATNIQGKKNLFFDSFSMPPPIESVEYARRIGKEIIFNAGHPIQDLESVRCGYYCLFFLNEIRRKSFYGVLKVFSLNDPMKNERFIKKYFL